MYLSDSKKMAKAAASLTIYDLPVELLDEVMSYLEPIDHFAAKISCRRLFDTRGSLKEITRDLWENPWETYLAKAWTEDTSGEMLLCSLCRDEHNASFFPTSDRTKPATTRSCSLMMGAIELGQSRLTLRGLNAALIGPPQKTTGGSRPCPSYPNAAHRAGVESGLEMSGTPHYLETSMHSPFDHYTDPEESVYSMTQEILDEPGEAILSSRFAIRLPFRVLHVCTGAEKVSEKDIRGWFRHFELDGGLWACPHIPMTSKAFLRNIISVLEGFLETDNPTASMKCQYCDSDIKMRAITEEVLYEDDDGGAEEEADWEPDELIINIRKGLGPLKVIGNHKYFALDEKLTRHLSRRIPVGCCCER